MLIKLTRVVISSLGLEPCDDLRINPEYIRKMNRDTGKDYTEIYLGDYIKECVFETPEEIIKLINESAAQILPVFDNETGERIA